MTPAFKNALARRGGWIALLDEMPDRVHQVSLAHTHAAIEEQRVIGFGRLFGDRAGSRVSSSSPLNERSLYVHDPSPPDNDLDA